MAGEKIKLWLTTDSSCLRMEISSRQPQSGLDMNHCLLEFAESVLRGQDSTAPLKRQRCQGNAIVAPSCVPRAVRCEQPGDPEHGFNLERFLAMAEANITRRVLEGKQGQRSLSFGATSAAKDWMGVEGMIW